LIRESTLPGFLVATLNSSVSLFLLALGIVGYLRGRFGIPARGVFVAAACIMVLFPLGPSPAGLIPAAVGAAIVLRHVWRSRPAEAPLAGR
jgi:hypothetical protein